MIRRKHCVFGCDFINGYFRPLHRFPDPVKQSKLFAAWVAAAGDYLKETDPVRIRRNKRVCDEHFEYSQRQARGRIIWAAVPAINLFQTKQTIRTIVESDHNYCVERYTRNPLEPSDVCNFSEMQTDLTTVKLEDAEADEHVEGSNTEEMAYSPASEVGPNESEDVPEKASQPQHDNETGIFSWQNDHSVIDTDVAVKAKVSKVSDYTALDEDACLYDDREPPRMDLPTQDDILPDFTYRCNECEGNITGLRYSCVQCVDFDLCGACEARGAHDTHYVLRVPPHRPHEEEQAMLVAIRLQLLHDQVFNQDENNGMEVKEEEEDTQAESRCEDPLSSDRDQERHGEGEIINNIKSKDDHHLPRKRLRLRSQSLQNTSLKFNENIENTNSDRLHDMGGIESDNPMAQDTNRHRKSRHSRTTLLTKGGSNIGENKTRILIKIPPGANAKDVFRRLSAREAKRMTDRLLNKEVTGILK